MRETYQNDAKLAEGIGHAAPQQFQGGCEARQSARGMLMDRVRRLRTEADQLEALSNALPVELPRQADAALWDLLVRR